MLVSQSSAPQMNGMLGVCQMMGMNTAGKNYNNNYVTSCNNAKQSCTNSCTQLHDKWSKVATALAPSCAGSSAISNAQSAANKMYVSNNQCNGYVANSTANQQSNMYGSNNAALQNVCSQLGMQPQTAQLQPMQAPQMPQTVDCSNPVAMAQSGGAAACTACAQANNGQPCATAVMDSGAKGSFQNAGLQANAASNFNVTSTGSGKLAQNAQFPDANASNSAADGQNPGMMGGMPGAGGIGAFNQPSGNNLNSAPLGSGRQGYRKSGYNTDVLLANARATAILARWERWTPTVALFRLRVGLQSRQCRSQAVFAHGQTGSKSKARRRREHESRHQQFHYGSIQANLGSLQADLQYESLARLLVLQRIELTDPSFCFGNPNARSTRNFAQIGIVADDTGAGEVNGFRHLDVSSQQNESVFVRRYFACWLFRCDYTSVLIVSPAGRKAIENVDELPSRALCVEEHVQAFLRRR